jgi:hypothetical protein
LTPAGEALLARAVPIWEHAHARLDTMLGARGAASLRTDLQKLG